MANFSRDHSLEVFLVPLIIRQEEHHGIPMIHDIVHAAVKVFDEFIKNALMATDGLLGNPAMCE